MLYSVEAGFTGKVALRKESVDRNIRIVYIMFHYGTSLSARRAWIEIKLCNMLYGRITVALRKESVDRNYLTFNSAVVLF